MHKKIMIHWILVCFGCCCGTSKKSAKKHDITRQQIPVITQELPGTTSIILNSENPEDSSDINPSTEVPPKIVIDTSHTYGSAGQKHLHIIIPFSEESLETPRSASNTPRTPRRNLPRAVSVKDFLSSSGLSKDELIASYTCCECSPGQIVDIDLHNETCSRRLENGEVTTEHIETLDCCIVGIDNTDDLEKENYEE